MTHNTLYMQSHNIKYFSILNCSWKSDLYHRFI